MYTVVRSFACCREMDAWRRWTQHHCYYVCPPYQASCSMQPCRCCRHLYLLSHASRKKTRAHTHISNSFLIFFSCKSWLCILIDLRPLPMDTQPTSHLASTCSASKSTFVRTTWNVLIFGPFSKLNLARLFWSDMIMKICMYDSCILAL